MVGHATCKKGRMGVKQRGAMAVYALATLMNWQGPFAMHSSNVPGFSGFVTSLDKMICIALMRIHIYAC